MSKLVLGVIGLLAIISLLILFLLKYKQKEGFHGGSHGREKYPIVFTDSDSSTDYIKEAQYGIAKSHVHTESIPGWLKQNESCLMATEPKFLPPKKDVNYDGCGWWFNDDTTESDSMSLGIGGSHRAPLLENEIKRLFPNGKWIWDTNEAQKLEDIKICKRIGICEIADLMPEKCGFCPTTNTGIPIKSDGKPLYSTHGCDVDIITNAYKCAKPNNSTADCEPDKNTGKLSKECLAKIARALKFNHFGAILKILYGDNEGYLSSEPTAARNKFRKALEQLSVNENITSRDAYFGKGVCTRYDVMSYYNSLKNVINRSTNKSSIAAASFLINGGIFNECDLPANTLGPFELTCVQQEAKKNKYSEAGQLYPKSLSDIDKFNTMTWGEVQTYFSSRLPDLQSTNSLVKNNALKDIYGINVNQKDVDIKNDFGGVSGLSYYVYEWLNSERPGLPKYTYFGRQVATEFPDFDNVNSNKEYQCKKIKSNKSQIIFKAHLTSDKTLDTKFWTHTDDGINISVNNINKLSKWMSQEQAVSYESDAFILEEQNPTKLEVNWYNNSINYTFHLRMFKNGKFDKIPNQLIYQTQPIKFPVARWDFYQGSVEDRCNILSSVQFGNIQITMLDNKKCALFKNKDEYIKINNGIHTDGFKTLTMMVNLQKLPYGPLRLWEFNSMYLKKPISNQKCTYQLMVTEVLHSSLSENNSDGMKLVCHTNNQGQSCQTTKNNSPALNTWTHLAWVFDSDSMTMYMNGLNVATYKGKLRDLENRVYENMYILNGIDSYDKEIGVAWFRIFDYPMTESDVSLDMNNRFAMNLAYPSNPTSGW